MPVTHQGRHIVVAARWLELGAEGDALHRVCGRRMAERGRGGRRRVRGLGAGGCVRVREERNRCALYRDSREAAAWLRANLRPGDAVLLKLRAE